MTLPCDPCTRMVLSSAFLGCVGIGRVSVVNAIVLKISKSEETVLAPMMSNDIYPDGVTMVV